MQASLGPRTKEKVGGRDRDRTGDPLLAKRKLGHRHHLLRRATKGDWVNVSAGIRALGHACATATE
jgi:hypothetical protein